MATPRFNPHSHVPTVRNYGADVGVRRPLDRVEITQHKRCWICRKTLPGRDPLGCVPCSRKPPELPDVELQQELTAVLEMDGGGTFSMARLVDSFAVTRRRLAAAILELEARDECTLTILDHDTLFLEYDIEWREIPGWPGYRVSTTGKIESCKQGDQWRPLKTSGTCRLVTLCKPSGQRQMRLGYLVLSTFVGAKPPGARVKHLDGDTGNNRLGNLKWEVNGV